MGTEQHRNFFGLLSDEHEGSFINLDLVRLVDQIRPGHIRLWFSETHRMEINGEGAGGMLARLAERAFTLDGSPVKDIGNINIATPLKSQSPLSASKEGQVQEP